MSTLILRHIRETTPPLFHVSREDGRATAPRPVPPAAGFPVEGRPGSDLMAELRWYLEDFLVYPFSPETEHAERVLAALDRWGRDAFGALFGDRDGGGMLGAATAGQGDYAALRLRVRSDEPGILAWPWEALHDPQAGALGLVSQVERRLDAVGDPPPLHSDLPRQRLHILLVTARPFERDVDYRSVSRPLVDLVASGKFPADVHLLRPPTFERLREHLRERPHHYHILHFDGHGGYFPASPAAPVAGAAAGPVSGGGYPHTFETSGGRLIFENATGGPAEVTAETLAPLLREVAVPVVVLNACQSGMLDGGAQSAFASVGAALLQSGTRGVVAMAYSLYVSGAQEFLPVFYRRLFESRTVAEAVLAGRQAMFQRPRRVCARERHPLRDWLVPVLYQHEDVDLSFAAHAAEPVAAATGEQKGIELGGDPGPHGFVGRDGPILRLERALRRRPAAILIHGLGGVGKTTLARGFVEWLRDTEGLGRGCLWFSFQEIRTAEYVLNRIGETLFGPTFATLGRQEKIAKLGPALRQERLLIVWDNFEVAAGIPGTAVAANLSSDDRTDLRDLLRALSGGATKVLITSRSEEAWLGEERLKLPLGGLQGEERWDYCGRILDDLGLKVNRDDADLTRLMDLLDGHPLAMRVVLRELERRTADDLIAALRSNPAPPKGGESAVEQRLNATLRFVEDSLPPELQPLLIPLAFYERCVDRRFLAAMAGTVNAAWSQERIDALLAALVVAGLLADRGQVICEMHPALTGFLRATVLPRAGEQVRDAWARSFAGLMAAAAHDLAPRPMHEQRWPFHWHQANFLAALDQAERLAMLSEEAALLRALGLNAHRMRRWAEAADLFRRLGELNVRRRDELGEAGAYNYLGRIAAEQRNFAAAESWYKKSLELDKRLGNDPGAAITYHLLGLMAEEQRDVAVAKRWYRKALKIRQRLGDELEAAYIYHRLGIMAGDQRDFANAERCYRKFLEIKQRLGDELGAAGIYHQLGKIAEERRDFAGAKRRYQQSLEISERLRIEAGAASTYYQLGRIAEEQRDYAAAQQWYQKSLQIQERLNDEHGAASTYCQLGILSGLQSRFEESARWLIRCAQSFNQTHDSAEVEMTMKNYLIFYQQASPPERQSMRSLWQQAGLPDLPWPHTE